MFSTRPRMTGLSGLPTEDMVRQIMQAESIRHTNMLRRVTLTTFRQEAFRGVAQNIRAFESSVLSMTSQNTIRLGRSFAANAASVTLGGAAVSSNVLRVTTAPNAAVGSHSFRVQQRAEAHRVVGATDSRFSPAMSGALDLDALLAVGAEGLNFSISHDGTAPRQIQISAQEIQNALFPPTPGETPSVPPSGWEARFAELVNDKLYDAFGNSTYPFVGGPRQNVSASFSDGRLNISVLAGHRAQIQHGTNAGALGIAHNTRTADPDFANMRLFDATEPIPGSVTGSSNTGFMMIAGQRIELTRDMSVADLMDRIAGSGADAVLEFDRDNSSFTLRSTRLGARPDAASFLGTNAAQVLGKLLGDPGTPATHARLEGSRTFDNVVITENTLLSEFLATGLPPTTFNINDGQVSIDGSTTVGNLAAQLYAAGVTLTFGENGLFAMRSNVPGEAGTIDLSNNDQGVIATVLSQFFGDGVGVGDIVQGTNAVAPAFAVHQGQHAIVEINGNVRHFNTNTIEIATGVTVTIGANMEIPEGTAWTEMYTVDITRNTEEIRNTILNFVEEYNKLIRQLNELVRTPRPRSSTTNQFYEPLTDEERRNLSESEVRMWDERAREGLLHRNSTIENIMRNMRMAVANHVLIDDGEGGTRRMSLSMIGITTTNRHADGGILEIDMERLDRWLQDDPDAVARMFTQQPALDATGDTRRQTSGIGTRLNDIVNGAIGSRGTITRIAGSEEWAASLNDNNMLRDIRNQNNRIDIVLGQLQRREEQLWRMFSRMETAMMQADQQMMSLMAMMGQGMMG